MTLGSNKIWCNKIWCKDCYEMWVKILDEKYGKGGWYFSNLETHIAIKDNLDIIGYPPSLKIQIKHKKKNGEYSDYKTKTSDLVMLFCPFCGKEINPQKTEEV